MWLDGIILGRILIRLLLLLFFPLFEVFSEDVARAPSRLAGACLSRPEELFVYECDGLTLSGIRPDAVVLPRDTAQVAAVVRACREFDHPFVPRGAGTGLSGGATAIEGGVIVELQRMNRVLRVDGDDRFAVVEPGVVNADLSKAVAHLGLFYAPDPSSQQACTIGGNVAENAGGHFLYSIRPTFQCTVMYKNRICGPRIYDQKIENNYILR